MKGIGKFSLKFQEAKSTLLKEENRREKIENKEYGRGLFGKPRYEKSYEMIF